MFHQCKWKECKKLIEAGEARLGKCFPSFFSDGLQVDWYHPECGFKAFAGMKLASAVPEKEELVEGLDSLRDEDREPIVALINEMYQTREAKRNGTAKKTATPKKPKAAASATPALGLSSSKPSPSAQKALIHGIEPEKKPAPFAAPKALAPASLPDPLKIACTKCFSLIARAVLLTHSSVQRFCQSLGFRFCCRSSTAWKP